MDDRVGRMSMPPRIFLFPTVWLRKKVTTVLHRESIIFNAVVQQISRDETPTPMHWQLQIWPSSFEDRRHTYQGFVSEESHHRSLSCVCVSVEGSRYRDGRSRCNRLQIRSTTHSAISIFATTRTDQTRLWANVHVRARREKERRYRCNSRF